MFHFTSSNSKLNSFSDKYNISQQYLVSSSNLVLLCGSWLFCGLWLCGSQFQLLSVYLRSWFSLSCQIKFPNHPTTCCGFHFSVCRLCGLTKRVYTRKEKKPVLQIQRPRFMVVELVQCIFYVVLYSGEVYCNFLFRLSLSSCLNPFVYIGTRLLFTCCLST